MKIAVFSDIHANSIALTAVLNEVDRLGIVKIIVCGDLVGYYYRAKEVLNLLKDRDFVACRGNHEDLFYTWCTGSNQEKEVLKKKYGSCFQVAENELSCDQKSMLFSLKHPIFLEFDNRRFCVSHGTPWNINQYAYFDQIEKIEDDFLKHVPDVEMIFLGHTHYQGIKKIKNIVVVNPGSVGQPRSGTRYNNEGSKTARAQWAIVDTSDLNVSFITTLYNTDGLFEEIDRYEQDPLYLRKVLYRTD